MPNGTYGGVRGRRKSSLLDFYNLKVQNEVVEEYFKNTAYYFEKLSRKCNICIDN